MKIRSTDWLNYIEQTIAKEYQVLAQWVQQELKGPEPPKESDNA